MKKNRLGRTGLMVSCIGLGGMGFTNKSCIKDDPHSVVIAALGEGINFIDTARSYYDSEKIIGYAIRRRRNDCFIATKTFLRDADAVRKEIDLSLRSLQVKKIDLYQIHHVQYEYELERALAKDGALAALKKARAEGKISYIGFSSHRPEMAIKCIKSGEFDTAQIPFNLIEREYIEEILLAAKEHDVGVIVMKPLAGGKLNNVGLALRFVLSYDIAVVIPGCSTAEQVIINARIGRNFFPLTEQEKNDIFNELKKLDKNFCRRCRYCEQSCPKKIPIPDIFRCEEHILYDAGYARYEYKRFRGEIKRCIACRECEKVCPYNLPIRAMLKKAHKRLVGGRIEDRVVGLLRMLRLYEWVRKAYFQLNLPLPKR